MMCGRGHATAAPVSCSVKPAVYLHIGGATEEQEQSGVCVLDVSLPFGQTLNVEQITFQNRYTAELSVRLLRRSQDGAPRWYTALSHLALMDDPHTEGGAQDHCCIHRTQMQVAPDHVTCVRLILRQPSSAWSSFSLENIQIHQQREQVCAHTHTHTHTSSNLTLAQRKQPDQRPLLAGCGDNQGGVASHTEEELTRLTWLPLQEQQVRSDLLEVNLRNAAGSDAVVSKVLGASAEPLAGASRGF